MAIFVKKRSLKVKISDFLKFKIKQNFKLNQKFSTMQLGFKLIFNFLKKRESLCKLKKRI